MGFFANVMKAGSMYKCCLFCRFCEAHNVYCSLAWNLNFKIKTHGLDGANKDFAFLLMEEIKYKQISQTLQRKPKQFVETIIIIIIILKPTSQKQQQH